MIPSIARRLRGNGFLAGTIKLTTGTLVAQVVGILATPILTRLYLPQAFGDAALFMSVTAIVGVVSCLKYELAIVLPADESEAVAVVWAAVFSVAVVSVLSTLVVLAGHFLVTYPPVHRAFGTCSLWIPPMVFLTGLNLIFTYWHSRSKRFGRNAVSKIIASFITQLVKLGGGFLGQPTGGMLISGSIAGMGAANLFYWVRDLPDWRGICAARSFQKLKEAAKRYRHFPFFASWSTLLNTASQQVPVLVMAVYFDQTIVGYYAFGVGILSLPMSLVAASVSQVFYQRASEIRATNGREISSKLFINLFAIGFFPFAFLALYGREVFALVFGAQWHVAGVYAEMLSVWTFFMFIVRPLSMTTSVYELQKIALVLQIILFSLRIGSVICGGLLGNAYLAVVLFSLTGAAHCLVTSLWYIHVAGGSVPDVLKQSIPIAGVAGLFLAIHHVVYHYVFPGVIGLVAVTVVTGVLYLYVVRGKIVLFQNVHGMA